MVSRRASAGLGSASVAFESWMRVWLHGTRLKAVKPEASLPASRSPPVLALLEVRVAPPPREGWTRAVLLQECYTGDSQNALRGFVDSWVSVGVHVPEREVARRRGCRYITPPWRRPNPRLAPLTRRGCQPLHVRAPLTLGVYQGSAVCPTLGFHWSHRCAERAECSLAPRFGGFGYAADADCVSGHQAFLAPDWPTETSSEVMSFPFE